MNSYWIMALAISLVVHLVAFASIFSAFEHKNLIADQEKAKEIKIVARKIEQRPKKEERDLNEIKPLPFKENIMHTLMSDSNPSNFKRLPIAPGELKEMKFLSLVEEKKLKKSPAYMNYYRIIREKIRANAYRNYYTYKEGEVKVSFFVLNDGSLSDIDLSSDSSDDQILRKIALRSINQSAPFPAFPQELKKYPYLKFNIPIYFKSN